MASNELRVGIRVGATDDGATAMLRRITGDINSMMGGLGAMGIGYGAQQIATKLIDAYSGQEAALARVRVMTMKVGDANEDVYNREVEFINDLSKRYPGSVEEYAKMQATLLRYRLTPEDIMGGVGETAAKLGTVFETQPDKAAAFFAKMKNDFAVQVQDMDRLANMLSKVHRMGVGIDGADAINEMTQAFSKEGLAVRNLGMQGAKAAEDLGLLSAIFINTGQTGQSVGTNLRRILEGAVNPTKSKKVRERGLQLGVDINFLDAQGNFAGIDNFVEQLSKLKNYNSSDIYHVLDPLAGKQGLSTSMDAFIAKFGEVEFKHYKEFRDSLVDINEEMKVYENTLAYIEDTRRDNFRNLQAALGGTMEDDLKNINRWLTEAAGNTRDWVLENPNLTKTGLEIAGIAASAGAAYTAFLSIGRFLPALLPLTTRLAASMGWATALAIGAVALKGIYDSTGSQVEEAGEDSKHARLIEAFDAKIEQSKTAEGSGFSRFMATNGWRLAKLNAATDYWMYGDDYLDDGPQGQVYNKLQREGFVRPQGLQGREQMPQMQYAPVFNMGNMGISQSEIDNIATANSKNLMLMLQDAARRNKNTTYGGQD